MKVVKKVEILSVARVAGIIAGGLYLATGLLVNLIVLIFGIPALNSFDVLGFGSGVLATLLVAVVVGAVSFIMGAVWTWLYNLAASLVGGISWHEAEIERSMFKKKDDKKPIDPQTEVNKLIKNDTFSSNDPNFLNS